MNYFLRTSSRLGECLAMGSIVNMPGAQARSKQDTRKSILRNTRLLLLSHEG